MRIYQRDESGVVKMKTVFWWNDRRGHLICSRVSFLWGYVKGLVYAPPLPGSIDELKQNWIMLPETCYSVFNKRLTTDLMCAYIEHLWNRSQNNLMTFNTETVQFYCARLVFKMIAFKMMSNFLDALNTYIYIYIYICVCVCVCVCVRFTNASIYWSWK